MTGHQNLGWIQDTKQINKVFVFVFLGFIDMHVFADEGSAWSEEK